MREGKDVGRNPRAAYVVGIALVSADRSLTLDMPPQGSSFRVGKIPWVRLDISERRSGF